MHDIIEPTHSRMKNRQTSYFVSHSYSARL